MQFLHISVQIH